MIGKIDTETDKSIEKEPQRAKVSAIYEDVELYVKFLRGIKGLSETTIKHYLSYYVHFKKKSLNQRWVELFLEQRKNNSVCRGFVKSYLEFLKKDHLFKIPKSKSGRTKKRIIRDMSKRELDLMLEELKRNGFKDWLFFNLLYYGALRRKELIGLKIKDFHWEDWFVNPGEDCYLHIFGKGKKERDVLIPSHVVEKILARLERKSFIPSEMGEEDALEKLKTSEVKLFNKLGERDCLRIINRITKVILGKQYATHEVRHTRATQMYNARVPVKQIQSYLGHSSLVVTEDYLHISEKESLRNISSIMKRSD